MKKLFISFLLSAYCLASSAAQLGFESENDEGEPNVAELIDNEDTGIGLDESAIVNDLLQSQKRSESYSGIRNNRVTSDSKRTQADSDSKPRRDEKQKAQSDRPLPFDAFAEIEETSFITSQSVSGQSGFDPVAVSKEFIGSIVILEDDSLIDEAMLEMVDDTVNMTLNIKDSLNVLDEQVTYKFYEGASKLGFDTENSYYIPGSGYKPGSGYRADVGYRDMESTNELFALASNSDSLNFQSGKPESIFTYVLYFPKFLTISNVLLMLGGLFVLNGVYRIMRFFLLRL